MAAIEEGRKTKVTTVLRVTVERRGEERKSPEEMREGGGAARDAKWQKCSRHFRCHFRCPSNLEGRTESGILGIVKVAPYGVRHGYKASLPTGQQGSH